MALPGSKEYWFLLDLAHDVENLRRNLALSMHHLAESLKREARRLEEEGADATFNSLGEVQGKGCEIDRMCGELDRVRGIYARACKLHPEAAAEAAATVEAALTARAGKAAKA